MDQHLEDFVSAGNFKQALSLCEKRLKKSPSFRGGLGMFRRIPQLFMSNIDPPRLQSAMFCYCTLTLANRHRVRNYCRLSSTMIHLSGTPLHW